MTPEERADLIRECIAAVCPLCRDSQEVIAKGGPFYYHPHPRFRLQGCPAERLHYLLQEKP